MLSTSDTEVWKGDFDTAYVTAELPLLRKFLAVLTEKKNKRQGGREKRETLVIPDKNLSVGTAKQRKYENSKFSCGNIYIVTMYQPISARETICDVCSAEVSLPRAETSRVQCSTRPDRHTRLGRARVKIPNDNNAAPPGVVQPYLGE